MSPKNVVENVKTCAMCGDEMSAAPEHAGKKFCSFCDGRIEEFITGNANHSVGNILWGRGKIGFRDAHVLRNIIKEYNITEVLEFGTGLSTEIFAILGLRSIVSCDVFKLHSDMCAQLQSLRNIVDFIYYPEHHLPDFEALYPGKMWEFVFVDGPHVRDLETEAAMRLSSRLIYLHDAGMSKYYSELPGFRQIPEGSESKLFERI